MTNSFWEVYFAAFLLPVSLGVIEIELTSEPIFGQDVLFTCTANRTNVISVTVNDYGTAVFERNSENTIIHLKSVLLNLTRRDPDPTNELLLTIFEVQGRVEEAQHSLNVKCADVKSFKTLFIVLRAAPCALPSPPVNGSIEAYNNTQVGTEIQFHCDEGYTPTEWKTAQCQQNGTWTPDPALLKCTSVLQNEKAGGRHVMPWSNFSLGVVAVLLMMLTA